jgi:hypothetical protein
MSARPADAPRALLSPRRRCCWLAVAPGSPRPRELIAPFRVPAPALTAAVAGVLAFRVLALALRGVLPTAS